MSEFKELIKSFSKSREYVRDFFVYGFKTRDEFAGWSGRTYDNERRRLESWLSAHVRQDYSGKGKNIYLSIDSNLSDTNPLYQVWKAKSFTDNDIMLHFYILDYLNHSGRRFLCLYLPRSRRFANARLDAIKEVIMKEPFPDYSKMKEKLEKNKGLAWGVSFQNCGNRHLERVKLTLHIDEKTESFILNRLKREGRGGTINRIAPDTFTYETQVFDANEMLPWIRTFIGRILAIESDCQKLTRFFERDFLAMYRMYFKESADLLYEE